MWLSWESATLGWWRSHVQIVSLRPKIRENRPIFADFFYFSHQKARKHSFSYAFSSLLMIIKILKICPDHIFGDRQ